MKSFLKILSARNIFLVFIYYLLQISAVIILCNLIVILFSFTSIHSDMDKLPASYTVMVLGAKVYSSGYLSPVLNDRVITALDLYNEGKVQRFLLSGDHGSKGYDEVNTMKNFLLKKGVNPVDIFMDHAGFETYDSIYRARDIFCVDKMIVVTQRFHLNRAVFFGKIMGIETYGFPADRRDYIYINNYRFREVLARVKAVLKVVIKAKPKFLGEKIPITEDSFRSWD